MAVNEFIPDIETLKEVVGAAVDMDISILSMAPYFEEAALELVIPLISQPLYSHLVTKLPDNADPAPTDQETEAIKLIRKVIAPYGIYKYYPIAAIRLTEAGPARQETETFKSAYKYQAKEYLESMIIRAWDNLEMLHVYLHKNPDAFSSRPESSLQYSRQYFINSAFEFKTAYNRTINRYTFEQIKSVMADVELFMVTPSLGEEYVEELKTQIKEHNVSNDNKAILPYLQKAVAWSTIEEAKKQFLVKIKGGRIIMEEALTSDSSLREIAPDTARIGASMHQDEEMSNRYLQHLIALMKKAHLEDETKYTLFNDYRDKLEQNMAKSTGETIEDELPYKGPDCDSNANGLDFWV